MESFDETTSEIEVRGTVKKRYVPMEVEFSQIREYDNVAGPMTWALETQ